MNPIELSLVIPIYRQEKTILHNLQVIIATLEKTRFSFEIIAVCDGFVDKSYQILQDAHLNHVQLIGYEKNHGKSYAIRKGIEKTRGENHLFRNQLPITHVRNTYCYISNTHIYYLIRWKYSSSGMKRKILRT